MREEMPGCGVGSPRASKVARDDVAGVARCYQPTLRNQEAAIAKGFYGGHFVADEKYRSAAGAHVAHFPETFLLKAGVPNGEHLVNQQDFRFKKRRNRKRQTLVHAAGVALDRGVDKAFDFGEGNNLVKLASDFAALHAQDCAVQVDILATS